jgi:hypothetical protein
MYNVIVWQLADRQYADRVLLYLFVGYAIFFIHLYIFRAIFNIPSFLRHQKVQIRLLEEIAKTQGVDSDKVQHIISETYGWDGTSQSTASKAQ